MSDIIDALQSKDDKSAYSLAKESIARSAVSDEHYAEFEGFVGLLTSKSSYVRTRGFCLCCAQARWDDSGKLAEAMPAMLALLHDEKPTVVRQCLGALREVVLYRPELCGVIRAEIEKMDLSRYRDSMSPLIMKDIGALLKMMK